MSRSLLRALFSLLVLAGPATAQVLDETMVPRGRLRLQVSPVFTSWDERFGRGPDGSEGVESLSDDLTDPASLSLFPGMGVLTSVVRDVTGLGGYGPVLGSTSGHIAKDMTRIDFGGHIGVFDWLTIGVVVPWMRTRTAVDAYFEPDTIAGNLGINPLVDDRASVDAFLASTTAADRAARANAVAVCAGGAGSSCTAAEALATRATDFDESLRTAYGATPFFPLEGTESADGLSAAAAMLSADLVAAGLVGLSPLALASSRLTAEGFTDLPSTSGTGLAAAPLETRQSLWSTGDLEISARVRLLDNLTPRPDTPPPGFGYRLTASVLARLPTGTRPDPNVFLDLGTGDGQTDFEGGLNAMVRFGESVGITLGGYYGSQGSTTVVTRVAAPELVMPPVLTRAELTWKPGFYVGGGVAPWIRLGSTLTLAAEYRFFHKGRDVYTLVDGVSGLEPALLEIESGGKVHMMGGGLRYDTVEPWQRGETGRPMEIHVRLLTAFAGSGGQTPKTTRVEAGLRLFRRFWGPS